MGSVSFGVSKGQQPRGKLFWGRREKRNKFFLYIPAPELLHRAASSPETLLPAVWDLFVVISFCLIPCKWGCDGSYVACDG